MFLPKIAYLLFYLFVIIVYFFRLVHIQKAFLHSLTMVAISIVAILGMYNINKVKVTSKAKYNYLNLNPMKR